MQTKPILIGFAAAILILVVAGASFTTGLYLGQRGYVDALQSQPQNGNPLPSGPANGQPNPNGFNPAGGPPGAPSWPADLMGRFVSKTADTIVIEGPQRQFTISVNADTRYTDENGNAIDPSIFQAGDTLAVFGRDVATLIMRLPPRPSAP